MSDRSGSPTVAFPLRARDAARPLVTVVVPVYNEEACLDVLHARLTAVLDQVGDEYEILLVNDGSRDRSLEIIRRLAASDPHVSYMAFTRNFGHEAATTCGIRTARGQSVAVIDADLQDPPELILDMLKLWRDGYDVVHAQRRTREGETVLTRLTSHLFYRVFKRLAGFEVPVDTGDFRLMDRAVVEAFCQLPERNRFVRGLVSWTGFRQKTVLYDRDPRLAGQTKYNFVKRLNLAVDAICGMSAAPLRWITYLGATTTLASFSAGLFAGALRTAFGVPISDSVLLAAAIFFIGGVQMLCTGALGEYLGRTYHEVQAKPLYLVGETHLAALGAAASDAARRTA
jgi:glycosyltransferase involved in cell wall biosynthesis